MIHSYQSSSIYNNIVMAKMNVTEKDFEAFFQATESLMAMSGTLDEGFDEEAYAINRQFKSFKRRYLKAKEDKK